MNTLIEQIAVLKPALLLSQMSSSAYAKKAMMSVEHIVKVAKVALNDADILDFSFLSEMRTKPVSSLFFVYNSKLVDIITGERNISSLLNILTTISETPLETLLGKPVPVISNLNEYAWALEFAASTVGDANKINGKNFAEMKPIDARQMGIQTGLVKRAIDFIRGQFQETFYSEITTLVSDIILFAGKGVTGGSSARVMGSIFIRVPCVSKIDIDQENISLFGLTPFVYYLEQIIHETAHLYLDQVMEFDKLILNAEAERYDSPIRIDKRPMRGVFHATYVLARLAIFFDTVKLSGEDKKCAKKRYISISKALAAGAKTIESQAVLTRYGVNILSEIKMILNKRSYE